MPARIRDARPKIAPPRRPCRATGSAPAVARSAAGEQPRQPAEQAGLVDVLALARGGGHLLRGAAMRRRGFGTLARRAALAARRPGAFGWRRLRLALHGIRHRLAALAATIAAAAPAPTLALA